VVFFFFFIMNSVLCIDPFSILNSCGPQAVSWWRYEWAAVAWGRALGLAVPNAALRGPDYPPLTVTAALQLSASRPTRLAHAAAARLAGRIAARANQTATTGATVAAAAAAAAAVPPLSVEDESWVSALVDPPRCAQGWPERLVLALAARVANANNGSSSNGRFEVGVLPGWALTWPGGQLAGVGRSGDFAANVSRAEAAFAARAPHEPLPRRRRHRVRSELRCVKVVDLSELASPTPLRKLLRELGAALRARRRAMESAKLPARLRRSSDDVSNGDSSNDSRDGDNSDEISDGGGALGAGFPSRATVEAYLEAHVAEECGRGSSRGSCSSSNSSRETAPCPPLKRNAGPATLRGLGAGLDAAAGCLGVDPTASERGELARRFAGQGQTLGRLRGRPLPWASVER
jgi:hypothetical protein